jgi:hypothetical protein
LYKNKCIFPLYSKEHHIHTGASLIGEGLGWVEAVVEFVVIIDTMLSGLEFGFAHATNNIQSSF